MRVDHAFDAESDSELSIQPGELITVLEEIDPGWYIGEILGDESRSGMFPATYCTVVDLPTPKRMSRSVPVSPGIKGDGPDLFADAEDQTSGLSLRRATAASPKPQIGARTMSIINPAVMAGKKKQPPPPPVSRGSKPSSAGTTVIGGRGEVKCKECGCDEFRANVFKKGSCNNCFHVHIPL